MEKELSQKQKDYILNCAIDQVICESGDTENIYEALSNSDPDGDLYNLFPDLLVTDDYEGCLSPEDVLRCIHDLNGTYSSIARSVLNIE